MRQRDSKWIIVLVMVLVFWSSFIVPVRAADASNVSEVASLLKDNYVDPVSDKVLKAPSVTLMLKALGDPYARYYTKEEFQQEMDQLNGTFTGVGVYFNPGKEGAEIMALVPGSPAEAVGLKVGDLIIKAGGHSLGGLTMEQVAGYIKGPAGTAVVLTIKRDGHLIDCKVNRQQIDLPSVDSSVIDKEVGLIELYEFGARSADEIGSAIRDLSNKKAQSWILDLRDNPGGFLEAATEIAGFFIGEGDTVIVKERNSTETLAGQLNEQYIDGPVILLVNENSASAAEIITAAFKDQQRALILGHTTYGKGTVQQIFDLSNGDRLKFTVARFYSPLDKPINKIGITPDIEVSDDQVMKAARLLLHDPPANYKGSLFKIDTASFSIGVDPVMARQADFWPAWSEVIKGCAGYQIYKGSEQDGWTELTAQERKSGWVLFYPDYKYQGEYEYKLQPEGAEFDFLAGVKSSYLNGSNIQLIRAATGERVPIQFTAGDKKVTVKALKKLASGDYWLVVDNSFLSFNDGHKLEQGLVAVVKVK
ncbi:MAG: S41 family peptidase [Deltaproteobacteria bacterium]